MFSNMNSFKDVIINIIYILESIFKNNKNNRF